VNTIQGVSLIQRGRMVIGISYCEPVVAKETAESMFRRYLTELGIEPSTAIAVDFDDFVSRLSEDQKQSS
jgi:hypothetical protein